MWRAGGGRGCAGVLGVGKLTISGKATDHGAAEQRAFAKGPGKNADHRTWKEVLILGKEGEAPAMGKGMPLSLSEGAIPKQSQGRTAAPKRQNQAAVPCRQLAWLGQTTISKCVTVPAA